MMLRFTVYGEAQPQGSAKAFIPKGWSRPVITSDNRSLRSWRQLVAEGANQALGALPAVERALLVEGVRLSIAFYLPRPKSLPKRATAHTKKPDLDKLVRAVKDGLKAVAWHDDSQVVDLKSIKRYAEPGTAPHAVITIQPVE